MFGPDANYFIHLQLCTGFICIGIATYFVQECIAQYKYMVSTIAELKCKCDTLNQIVVEYDTRINNLEYALTMLNQHIDEVDIRLNNEIADELDYIEDKLNDIHKNMVTKFALQSICK